MTKSKATAISWVALSLGFAVFIGILGRAYLPELVNGNNEKVFIEMIKKVFTMEMRAPFIAGLFLCGILQRSCPRRFPAVSQRLQRSGRYLQGTAQKGCR